MSANLDPAFANASLMYKFYIYFKNATHLPCWNFIYATGIRVPQLNTFISHCDVREANPDKKYFIIFISLCFEIKSLTPELKQKWKFSKNTLLIVLLAVALIVMSVLWNHLLKNILMQRGNYRALRLAKFPFTDERWTRWPELKGSLSIQKIL